MFNLKKIWLLFLQVTVLFSGAGCSVRGSDIGSGDENYADADADYVPVDFYAQCRDIRCDFMLDNSYNPDSSIEHGVATWHSNDTGIRLAGEKLKMLITDSWAGDPLVPVNCYTVTLLGYWESDVDMYLDVDIVYLKMPDSDSETGSDDEYDLPGSDHFMLEPSGEKFSFSRKLTSGDWQRRELNFKGPKQQSAMTFGIRKEGEGDALFYFIEVDGNYNCDGTQLEID